MHRVNTATWLEKYQRWQIKVQKDGVRKTFCSSVSGKEGQRDCNGKADDWLEDNIVNPNTRVSVIYDEWLQHLKNTTGKGHWSLYEGYWKNWIIPDIGTLKIGKLTEDHFQSIIDKAATKGKKRKAGLSKKTLENMRACMANFVKYARKKKATKLVLEDVTIPNSAPVGDRTILQPGDLTKLFKQNETILRGKRKYDLYVNAYRFEAITGLRPGEVIGLKWNDVSDDKINLKRSINKFNETTRGKNKNARRTFVITPLAMEIISHQKAKLAELNIESEYVFPNEQGEHIVQRTYHKRWVAYRGLHNISEATPYELRHTFVSVVKTLPEGLLKPLVGHSKDMDTYGTYSHELAGDMEQTAVLVQALLSKVIKK